jgi:hypothetical protein
MRPRMLVHLSVVVLTLTFLVSPALADTDLIADAISLQQVRLVE